MLYNTILFDLDGTVLDTSLGILHAVEHTVRTLGLPPLTAQQQRSVIGPPIDRSFRTLYGMDEDAAARAAAVFREAYAHRYLMEAEAYPGIVALLHALRRDGWRVGVATYKRDDYAQPLMERTGVRAACDFVLGSDGKKQTKADIIRLCLQALGCPGPAECIMVGDTLHDWEGARQAGAAFVGVTYGFGFTEPGQVLGLEGALGAAASAAELGALLASLRA